MSGNYYINQNKNRTGDKSIDARIAIQILLAKNKRLEILLDQYQNNSYKKQIHDLKLQAKRDEKTINKLDNKVREFNNKHSKACKRIKDLEVTIKKMSK